MLGLLYDIHGNIPALEQVLAQADAEGVDRWLLGGDYGTPSPWPLETLDRLKQLPDATWIRGNGERWLREPPLDRPEVMESYEAFVPGLPDDVVDWLYATAAAGRGRRGALRPWLAAVATSRASRRSRSPTSSGCSPVCATGSWSSATATSSSAGPGPTAPSCVNPGSVGMPLDGDTRSAWAVRTDDGKFAFRRTEYDVQRAADGYRKLGGEFGEFAARRIERGSD